MSTRKTPGELLSELRQLGESGHIEAKRSFVSKALTPTISAFSNSSGGYLLIGVEPIEGYPVLGSQNADQHQQELAQLCRSSFNVMLRPDIRIEEVEGKTLISAFIPETPAHNKPVYLRKQGLPKGAHIRVGAASYQMTDADIRRLFSQSTTTTFDRRPFPQASLDDIDTTAIDVYRQELRHTRPGSELLTYADGDLMRAIGALVDDQGEAVPSAAGVLLLGSRAALRRLFPLMRIDYIRINSTDWTGEQNDTYTVLELREALMTGWRRLFNAIFDDLPKTFSLPSGNMQRKDIPAIPANALREAIINALVHRDYQVDSPIQVRRYTDRIEIENPGYSLVAADRLGQPISKVRNPTLTEVFRELGLAEARGTGIRRIREQVRRHGLPEPHIQSDREQNRFVLTLTLHHLLEDEDQRWLSRLSGQEGGDSQVLIYLRTHDRIANREVQKLTGDTASQAGLRLRRLFQAGHLQKHGKNRGTTYSLSLSAQSLLRSGLGENPISDENQNESEKESITGLESELKSKESLKNSALSRDLSVLSRELDPQLLEQIHALPGRVSRERFEGLLLNLLKTRYWPVEELATLVNRTPDYLSTRYLTPLARAGRIVAKFPDTPNHPHQAWRTARSGE